ncbi:MAG: hypothetical protein MJ252_28875 [archaeon]|nr:hypothetical protein [archaeon]
MDNYTQQIKKTFERIKIINLRREANKNKTQPPKKESLERDTIKKFLIKSSQSTKPVTDSSELNPSKAPTADRTLNQSKEGDEIHRYVHDKLLPQSGSFVHSSQRANNQGKKKYDCNKEDKMRGCQQGNRRTTGFQFDKQLMAKVKQKHPPKGENKTNHSEHKKKGKR